MTQEHSNTPDDKDRIIEKLKNTIEAQHKTITFLEKKLDSMKKNNCNENYPHGFY